MQRTSKVLNSSRGTKYSVIYKLRKTSTANVPLPPPNQEKTDYQRKTRKSDTEKKIDTKCEICEGVEEHGQRLMVVVTNQSMEQPRTPKAVSRQQY